MIFFGIPSVGQIKPKTLFGDDNHYGFIQTLLGEKYERSVIAKKCSEYYDKDTDEYWDRIITISNFLGIKKLDEENKFCDIPLLDFVVEKFDQSDFEPSQILFDYLLCQWQYPHPTTKTTDLGVLDIRMVNPRQNVAIFKPYILILGVLKELYNMSPKSSYFTKEEFYWFGYHAYKSNCSNMVIGNENNLAKSILDIRKNGWSKFKSIKKSGVHLSYPLGFLRNSSVLTDNGAEYNVDSKFFIGLKKSGSIIADINSLINSSKKIFEFDRDLSAHNEKLGFQYSNYLYETKSIKDWLDAVSIYDNNKYLFISLLKDRANFNESEFKKRKVEIQLNRLSDLDQISISKRRTEQYILREYLLGGHDRGSCAICSKVFPIKFLATAHIKKRSKCTIEEKKDINIVMPTCHFGCDKLFEDGYVIVKEGIIKNNISKKQSTPSIEDYIHNLENNKCNYYNENTQRYFKEHEGSYV
jgi:hypothetical protein